jgi:signal peptidase I
MTEAADTETPDDKAGAVKEFIEIVKTVAYALGIALVLRVLLFQPFTIPSASMEPNLYQGDYIIVSKFSYGWSKHSIPFSPPLFNGRILAHAPNRGDIIVFKLPRDPNVDYIKRLIGLPGDKVQVRGGVVYINGKALERKEKPSALVDTGYGTIRAGRFEETNPEGRKYATQDYGPDSEADNTGVYTVPRAATSSWATTATTRWTAASTRGSRPSRPARHVQVGLRQRPVHRHAGRRRLRAGREPGGPRPADPAVVERRRPPVQALDLVPGRPSEPLLPRPQVVMAAKSSSFDKLRMRISNAPTVALILSLSKDEGGPEPFDDDLG